MHHLERAMPLRRSTPSVVNLSHHVFVQKTHWSYRLCSCVFAHFFGCGCWSYVTAGANFVRFNYRQPIICSPTLQGRIKSNLKKIPLKNRRCHFDKRDALVWKLVLFSFLIGVQARSPISQLRDELFKKFQKWKFFTPNDPTFDHTQLFSKFSPSGQKIGF